MSESGDYDPGPWSGYSFEAAREVYDKHVGRSYEDAKEKKKEIKDLMLPQLVTQSESPVVIAIDVTGSMGEWPATIFSKLPYLDLEGQEYLGKTMAISFAAFGDTNSDTYPLQVRDFSKGKDLEKRLKELVIEGGGGPGKRESYEVAALYYARNCEMKNATKPVFIFIGDEGFYDFIDKDDAKKYANVKMQEKMTSLEALAELKNKFSVYMVRKPYQVSSSNSLSTADQVIQAQWEQVLGEDHVAILPEAGRVVDVIFGIFAQETGRVPYFQKELEGRQTPAQVKTVLKSLTTVHKIGYEPEKKAGKSVLHKTTTGKKSLKLLEG